MLRWLPTRESLPEDLSLMERLLAVRGFDDPKKADWFLNPSREHLFDPMLLPGMSEAVRVVQNALRAGKTIVVYGDYDVDGVTATAILTGFFEKLGVPARHYIPSRHHEGYGLNDDAIRKIAEASPNCLLITVDCGITASDQIALARTLGMETVVTDHHRPGDALPEGPVVNPALGYPHGALCGAGVAFKLCQALDESLAYDLIDLAALGTVADVVPLADENRTIAALGIAEMNRNPRPGVLALMEKAGIGPGQVTAGRIAFQLAPRLNAGGRVGDAERSLMLLTARSADQAMPFAEELETENLRRKSLETAILKAADEQLKDYDFPKKRSIVLFHEGWNAGVLGLAASRLVEKYHVPTILMRLEGTTLSGSCRSIPGVDIFKALSEVSEYLTRFGGHSQAAGLTLALENLTAFSEALDAVILRETEPDLFIPAVRYDMKLRLSELDDDFIRTLARFEPTGFGNPAPVFLTEADIDSAEAVGAEGAHLRLRLRDGAKSLPGIAFSMGSRAKTLPGRVRALYAPKMAAYRGREYPECRVQALEHARYGDAFCRYNTAFDESFQTFLTNRLYNKEYSTRSAGHYSGYDPIFRRLASSPRGTLVLAFSEARAKVFLEAAQTAIPDRMDICLGCYPTDRRAFNALCLLPPGMPPAGYDTPYSLDAVSCLWGFETLEPEDVPGLTEDVFPDLDALRDVFIAAREFSRRPNVARTVDAVTDQLANSTGLPKACVFSGLSVLDDMNLIRLRPTPPILQITAQGKANPLDNPVFQWMRTVSTGR